MSLALARRAVLQAATGGVFDPATIADLAAWYEADAIVGLVDGDPVASWSDSSANARTMTQATSAARPTYKTAIVHGKPVVRFDGVDDELANASFMPANADGTAMTSFAVVRSAVTGTGHVMGTRVGGGGWIHRINTTAGTAWGHFAIGGAGQTDPVTTTAWNVLEMTGTVTTLGTAGTFATGHNGVMQAATSSPPTAVAASAGTALGRQGPAYSITPLNGDLAEVLIYARQLSVAERDQIETYLGAKYAITVA